jgi:hypothetical protein
MDVLLIIGKPLLHCLVQCHLLCGATSSIWQDCIGYVFEYQRADENPAAVDNSCGGPELCCTTLQNATPSTVHKIKDC